MILGKSSGMSVSWENKMAEITEGRKDDSGKLRYDLIPPRSLEALAHVYTIGAKKYAARNWEKGITWGRVFAAMMRHSWAWWRGEKFDPVDGQHHLASVAWCAFALMEYEFTHEELDDRPYSHEGD
jgi:hypothetical protein